MLEQFSATINKIYAAAADAGGWVDALHSIEELTGSAGAVIGFVPKRCEVGFNLAGRFTAEQCATYSEHYQPICRRTRYMIEHPELDVICDALLITEMEMDTDPVYEWFGQHGLRYFVGTALPETQQYRAIFSLQRSPTQGHVQRNDIELFKLITPHLARALNLADQLGTLRSHHRFSSAILEALPQAVFALDNQGHVLFANASATALLSVGNGLGCFEGRLRTRHPSEQPRLDAMIRDAALMPISAASGWSRISRVDGGLPYAVFVAPLNVADEELTAARAEVLVVVHDTSEHRCASVEMLTGVYGLTETEARLASALSGGHSLESAAVLLHMAPATARAHLKAVFRKINVNRQQDLVRVLASLSVHAPLAASGQA